MANPVLNEKFAEQEIVLQSEPMTINGTLKVTAMMGVLLLVAASYTWSRFMLGYSDLANMLTIGGAIAGLIFAFIISFGRVKALIPLYTIAEGLFLGGISAVFEASYPGIVLQAVAATFAALFSMLILYRTGVIRSSEKFRGVILTATASIFVVYVVDIIGHLFGLSVPLINTSTPFGIGFSVLVVAIAALNLIVDFEFIERGVTNMLPKDFEWFGAYGLMVTMIWLYIEILKLLAKLNNRR